MAEKSIGGLWKNKTKKGDTYLSGSIEIGGEKVKIVIFKNNYKEEEKHPDYRIFESKPQKSDEPEW